MTGTEFKGKMGMCNGFYAITIYNEKGDGYTRDFCDIDSFVGNIITELFEFDTSKHKRG